MNNKFSLDEFLKKSFNLNKVLLIKDLNNRISNIEKQLFLDLNTKYLSIIEKCSKLETLNIKLSNLSLISQDFINSTNDLIYKQNYYKKELFQINLILNRLNNLNLLIINLENFFNNLKNKNNNFKKIINLKNCNLNLFKKYNFYLIISNIYKNLLNNYCLELNLIIKNYLKNYKNFQFNLNSNLFNIKNLLRKKVLTKDVLKVFYASLKLNLLKNLAEFINFNFEIKINNYFEASHFLLKIYFLKELFPINNFYKILFNLCLKLNINLKDNYFLMFPKLVYLLDLNCDILIENIINNIINLEENFIENYLERCILYLKSIKQNSNELDELLKKKVDNLLIIKFNSKENFLNKKYEINKTINLMKDLNNFYKATDFKVLKMLKEENLNLINKKYNKIIIKINKMSNSKIIDEILKLRKFMDKESRKMLISKILQNDLHDKALIIDCVNRNFDFKI